VNLILLENQDRSLWNREQIAQGLVLSSESLASRRIGPYALQAAIAAVHAQHRASAKLIGADCGIYNVLLQMAPSPVVELNRAVAVAMRDGPQGRANLIDAICARELSDTTWRMRRGGALPPLGKNSGGAGFV